MESEVENDQVSPASAGEEEQTSHPSGKEILAAMRGEIDPVRSSLMYRIAILLVAVAMLVLPVIYFALIGLVSWGVYWHATHDLELLSVSRYGPWVAILGYVGPIIVGCILVFFLLKPIFARGGRQSPPLLLEREKEPVLYAFVDRLCEIVGSPKPRRIYVDCQLGAAAGLNGGIVGWTLGRVDLYLGLPLVLNLNLRQTVSILSHEMRHFAQGSAMRLSFIIRKIDYWFGRIIYQRDNWDRALFRMSHNRSVLIRLIGIIAATAVKLTRKILYLLLVAGHAISCVLMRQMEFDADQLSARIAGSDAAANSLSRTRQLEIAFQTTMNDVDIAWRERRLPDDLPLYLRNRETAIPEGLRKVATAAIEKIKGRWFHTHPTDLQRIERIRRENAAGIFTIDAPTSAIFSDPKELSRLVTIQFYQKFVGKFLKPEHLYLTEDISAKHEARREQHGSLQRYFQGLIDPGRPIFPEQGLTLPTDPDELAANVMQGRSQMEERRAEAVAAARSYKEADGTLIRVVQGRALRDAGVDFKPASLKMTRADWPELDALEQRARADLQTARNFLEPFLRGQMRRMQTAIATAATPAEEAAPEPEESDESDEIQLAEKKVGPEERIRAALRVISQAAEALERLRWRFIELDVLLPRLRPDGNPKKAGAPGASGQQAHVRFSHRRSPDSGDVAVPVRAHAGRGIRFVVLLRHHAADKEDSLGSRCREGDTDGRLRAVSKIVGGHGGSGRAG
jgi:Zn-dependent protease with chaperone function